MCHGKHPCANYYEPIEDWVLFPPDERTPCSVLVFNFGNEPYEPMENTWYVCGTWKTKAKLIHRDKKTMIDKIAKWKVVEKPFTAFYKK